jgi:integrase
VVDVKLRGLKIARARGKYYVYRRSDGVALLKGFVGNEDALRKRLAEPDMIGLYNVGRKRAIGHVYPEKTLGWLVKWFTDPEQCEPFKDLSEVTQKQYKTRLAFLEDVYDDPLDGITSPDIYQARDRASKEKWPVFANHMVNALATMFTLAVERGWMKTNPAKGIRRVYKADPNANREWRPEELAIVLARAPLHLRIAYMMARHVGYRSQSIVAVKWSNYQPDPKFGMCFRIRHRKNKEEHWLPAAPVLQDFLADLTKTSPNIAVCYNGMAWTTPKQLSTQSSNFLAELEKEGIIGAGLTLHGLRSTFAADIKRVTGANDDQVAAALGDRDTRMGRHYSRHVEQENKIIYLFATKQWRTGTERDLENMEGQAGKRPGALAKIVSLPSVYRMPHVTKGGS